jgi:spermidine synthase
LNLKSNILKAALFATGLSGIVAEYILSTLATYFLGDSVVQWTLIVSTMLFSMGLGSRFSRYFQDNLVVTFITIEFTLSIFSAFSSLLTYTTAAYTAYTGTVIYGLAIIIGFLIGLEIPLATRLNSEFQALRVNISAVLENDYYGSLLGGVFFAFVALPYIGLTYTPFILGGINFIVAVLLWYFLREKVEPNKFRFTRFYGVLVTFLLLLGATFAEPIVLFGEQQKYADKIIYSEQSKYQKIVITQWKNDYWLFINGNQQLSTLDEALYHEPLIHPIMQLAKDHRNVIVLGGGDGAAVREILKYPDVDSVTVVDLDPVMTRLGKEHPVLVEMNNGSMNNAKVRIVNQDAFQFLESSQNFYDVIICDFPDPKTVELGRLYSLEFYVMCKRRLKQNGWIITQAGSPYYAPKAFQCIDKTVRAAGFNTQRLHNQILTLGEWGWIIGEKSNVHSDLKKTIQQLELTNVKTEWLNNDALVSMTNFGKAFYAKGDTSVTVNTIRNPVLYRYYIKGSWDLY